MFDFMPEQASTIAPKIDWLNHLVTVISVFFTVVIVGAMIYFAVRYRKRGGQDHETPRIEGNGFLEVVWTTVPTLICILIGYYGVAFYREMRAEESNPVEINVWGQKWRWDFEYPNGKKTNAELVVPVGRQVKLITRSRDVIHSFFIPAMRVKRDVLPTEYGSLYFTPIKTGDYNVFCTEYCGQDHWDMLAKLRVVSQAEYDRWLQDRSAELEMSRMSPVELGKQLYNEKGCLACHSLDGSPRVGPSFLKLYGREGEFADGATYKADENYIQESVLHPNKHIVKGFPANQMPSFEGQVTDEQISALIAFIKAQDGTQPLAEEPQVDSAETASLTPVQRGEKLYRDKVCFSCHSLDGSKIIGPSFKGIYGKQEQLADGSSVKVDDQYLKESMLDPSAKIVSGFAEGAAMPPYQGQLTDEQIADLIEFIKSLN